MNLVKLITDQFSDETLNKLGGLLGTDAETASAAATAAVPTLLSGLAGMASRGEGANKLADVLRGIDPSSMGNIGQLLGSDPNALLNKGSGLLSSLFGDGMIAGIAGAVSRYTGLNPGAARSLLAYLMPLVLGKVAGQWKSQGGTIGALTSMFAEQKRNIADAVPAGFSLDDIPGMAGVSDASRAVAGTTRRAAETAAATSGSMANWLLPLAILLVGGFLLWNFLTPREAEAPVAADKGEDAATTTVMKPVVPETDQAPAPETPAVPNATQLADEFKGVLTLATTELDAITDAATAEAAMPKLQDLKTKLDGIQASFAKLPAASQPAIREAVDTQMSTVKQKAEQVAELPGVSDRFKALINEILQKLSEFMAPAIPAAA